MQEPLRTIAKLVVINAVLYSPHLIDWYICNVSDMPIRYAEFGCLSVGIGAYAATVGLAVVGLFVAIVLLMSTQAQNQAHTKQRHASAKQRSDQAKQAFYIKNKIDVDSPYLIIDDVITTGATAKTVAATVGALSRSLDKQRPVSYTHLRRRRCTHPPT